MIEKGGDMKTLCGWVLALLAVAVSNDAAAQPTAAVMRNADPKIVGGWPSKPGSRPFQAALLHAGKPSNFDAQFCGGSIIGRNAVLTAAHCVQGKTAADIEILSGTDRLMVGGARTPVVKIAVYGRYDKVTQDGDIAVITTRDPLLGRALALATEADELEHAPAGAAATVTGWGNTEPAGQNFPDALLEVIVPIVALDTCHQRYAELKPPSTITALMICAGYKRGGKDSCQGDSGGPLFVSTAKSVLQVGVVSWGIGCAAPENYGVYARVSRLRDWIYAQVGERCTKEEIDTGNCLQ